LSAVNAEDQGLPDRDRVCFQSAYRASSDCPIFNASAIDVVAHRTEIPAFVAANNSVKFSPERERLTLPGDCSCRRRHSGVSWFLFNHVLLEAAALHCANQGG
jgi:hypothetical protein